MRDIASHPQVLIIALSSGDKAGRFTWRFLRDATAEQIRTVTNYALAADNKLTNGLIMNRLSTLRQK